MTFSTIDPSQRKAARIVGSTYLFAMATAVFTEFHVRGHLIVYNNPAETARNIMAHERLFRLGIASWLLCLLSDIALITALYVILKRVSQHLALFALVMRVVEHAIGAAATLTSFNVLRLVSGADYLQALTTGQLQALARLSLGAYGDGINVAFVFLGLGSAVFGYLWFRSNYIPRALAALGVFGSLLLATGSFALIIFPAVAHIAGLGYMAPLGVFEVTMGFWLLIKGLRPSAVAVPTKPAI